MAHKSATDIMEGEHGFILQVARAMPVLADQLEAGQELEPALILEIVDFMRNYADKAHHGKEEDRLFPLLEQRGVPPVGCPIGALAHEHAEARGLVGELARAVTAYVEGRSEARESVVNSLRRLAHLYPDHIWKEDYLLFPMTNKVLNTDDQACLLEEFYAVDSAIGREAFDRYEQFAETLHERLNR